VWCVVCGVWCVVCGVWCVVVWCGVCDADRLPPKQAKTVPANMRNETSNVTSAAPHSGVIVLLCWSMDPAHAVGPSLT
jgi:hypothetical protein